MLMHRTHSASSYVYRCIFKWLTSFLLLFMSLCIAVNRFFFPLKLSRFHVQFSSQRRFTKRSTSACFVLRDYSILDFFFLVFRFWVEKTHVLDALFLTSCASWSIFEIFGIFLKKRSKENCTRELSSCVVCEYCETRRIKSVSQKKKEKKNLEKTIRDCNHMRWIHFLFVKNYYRWWISNRANGELWVCKV